jgi:phosphatidylinositol alpha-1,6-mannosyltransferase
VIFAQSVLPFAWFIYLIRRISAAKVITFVYGEDIVPLRKQEMAKRISRKIYLTGLRNVDYIIANSKVTMNEVIRDGIATGKVTVIHPAVDYDFFTLQDRREMKERLGLTDKFVLLSVGRLVRRKGFDRVIEQMPRLIKEIPNILYIICGEGPDDTRLREIASRNGAVKYIKFIRGLPTVDLPVLYSASDLFVMPNRLDDINGDQEGFGIVFLEANACGLPVIGGDSGGVRDVIEDRVNGFLVDPLDSERLAELIVECYLGKHSFEPTKIREHIMQRFSWTHSSSSFNSLLAIT